MPPASRRHHGEDVRHWPVGETKKLPSVDVARTPYGSEAFQGSRECLSPRHPRTEGSRKLRHASQLIGGDKPTGRNGHCPYADLMLPSGLLVHLWAIGPTRERSAATPANLLPSSRNGLLDTPQRRLRTTPYSDESEYGVVTAQRQIEKP